jgi:DNA-binding NarL/FixJ family response regulator
MQKSLKIILIDENVAFRIALKSLLIKEYHAEIIGEIAQINELQNIHNYNVANIILIDLVMPEITGIKNTIEILKNDSQLKFIAITSYSEKIYHTNLIEAGFVGCIYKAELFNQLAAIINSVTQTKN